VNGFDFWNNSDTIKPENRSKMGTILHTRVVSTESGENLGILVTESVWFTGEGKQIIDQKTRYVFMRESHARVIDEVVTLKALDRVVFKDDKDGCSACALLAGSNRPRKRAASSWMQTATPPRSMPFRPAP